jgi:anti-sigma factor RsiW
MTSPLPPRTTDAADQALDEALRGLHCEVLAEPVPPSLHAAAQRLDALHHSTASNRQWLGLVASLLLAVSVGWFAHGLVQPSGSNYAAKHSVEREFVRQARFAHEVYLPEKRHPVEVVAAEQEHLVQWLSKRLGKPLKVPHLAAQGFELVGGRLLPGDTGARAQFMFQNAQGARLTLYMGSLQNSANPADLDSTQFRFESTGNTPSFYWADRGFGYALSGQVDKAMLMALSTSIYAQINAPLP